MAQRKLPKKPKENPPEIIKEVPKCKCAKPNINPVHSQAGKIISKQCAICGQFEPTIEPPEKKLPDVPVEVVGLYLGPVLPDTGKSSRKRRVVPNYGM